MEPIYISIQPQETGHRIHELMKESGLNVRDIQEAMGFANPQAVYKWISGKSMPSLDNLVILSTVLHKRMDEILVVDGDFAIFGFALYYKFFERYIELYRNNSYNIGKDEMTQRMVIGYKSKGTGDWKERRHPKRRR